MDTSVQTRGNGLLGTHQCDCVICQLTKEVKEINGDLKVVCLELANAYSTISYVRRNIAI
jgi:hypothetical protein